MTVYELNQEQLTELKENYLTQYLLEVEDRTPSYYELANINDIVDDRIIYDNYSHLFFSNDDFACTAEIPMF